MLYFVNLCYAIMENQVMTRLTKSVEAKDTSKYSFSIFYDGRNLENHPFYWKYDAIVFNMPMRYSAVVYLSLLIWTHSYQVYFVNMMLMIVTLSDTDALIVLFICVIVWAWSQLSTYQIYSLNYENMNLDMKLS